MSERIFGVDVSKWQGTIDWSKMVAGGMKFAFIKSTEGIGGTDRKFTENWAKAKEHGLLRSHYHFLRPEWGGRQQAQHYFETINKTGDLGELPPVLDVEKRPLIAKEILAALKEIERLFGRQPIIYTGGAVWNEMGGTGWAKKYPLWIAQYPYAAWMEDLTERLKDKGPRTPKDWNGNWLIWQFTERGPGKRYGVESSRLDINFFNGDAAALQAFANGAPLPSAGMPTTTPPPQPPAVTPRPVAPPPPPARPRPTAPTGGLPEIPALPKVRVLPLTINVRSSPEVAPGNLRGRLRRGSEPTVMAIHKEGRNIWVQIGWQMWMAYRYAGRTYLQFI